ncbi:putative sterigmatocystin biosynthesis monooxygenase stcW [Trichoderma lentiforme]|uniref:Sterigmatocystin biosynthesis monooxygenase stcW n=1 Tax=Trichoderma lentiforme TaxID=1567552 RepID=A0A9P4X3H6_9HYPO|nr:putative sterigmatocystin biosynthesis monooxygenase stcW [Trichoderma lentiforme]
MIPQSTTELDLGLTNEKTNGSRIDTTQPKSQVSTAYPRVVENFRPMSVIIIGAGFSGIYCGVRIPERLRNVKLTIYEKNSRIGGTWHENRYPGCACDIPAHSYQYTFAPNPNWSRFYAPAAEICKYLESVAERYSVNRFIKTLHKVTNAKWKEDISKWEVTVKNLKTGETIVDIVDVVISARGMLNEPAWPDIPGVSKMKIPVLHSAVWDDSITFEGKKIGIIGGGSSAIQIIPALQRVCGTHLSCFIRSTTWISRPFGDSVLKTLGLGSTDFSPELKAKFTNDPQYYLNFRTIIERDGNSAHSLTFKDSETQSLAREDFTALMKEKLAKKPYILEALMPSFSVGCRRLTPGPGYLEALGEDNVDFINTPISKATDTSLVLQNGEIKELDVLVCATGFQTSAPPPFSVIGKHGQTMKKKFEPYPETYLSLATDGFPNYFMMLGPNAAIGTGPLTTMIEKTGDYIIKCIRKLQKENLSSMEPKSARVKDFSEVIDRYFKDTVYVDKCSSWYKSKGGKGDRIVGIWPGSALHALETLRSPRWEDFNYVYNEETQTNRLSWLGDGWSAPQVNPEDGELAHFIQPAFVDLPASPYPEETVEYKQLPFSH